MPRDYLMVFHDWPEKTRKLSFEEKGRLLEALVLYSRGQFESCDDVMTGNEVHLFPVFTTEIDRAERRYNELSEKRKEAGSNGGKVTQASRHSHCDKTSKTKQMVAKGSKTSKSKECNCEGDGKGKCEGEYNCDCNSYDVSTNTNVVPINNTNTSKSICCSSSSYTPPTIEEVEEYFNNNYNNDLIEYGLDAHHEAEGFILYNDKNGWKNCSGSMHWKYFADSFIRISIDRAKDKRQTSQRVEEDDNPLLKAKWY